MNMARQSLTTSQNTLLCVSVLSEHSALCAGLLCRFGLLLQLCLVCFTFGLAQTCVNQLGEPLAHYKKDIESHFQSIKSFQAKLGMERQVLTVELQQWSVTVCGGLHIVLYSVVYATSQLRCSVRGIWL